MRLLLGDVEGRQYQFLKGEKLMAPHITIRAQPID
jgi:hypothetical protein